MLHVLQLALGMYTFHCGTTLLVPRLSVPLTISSTRGPNRPWMKSTVLSRTGAPLLMRVKWLAANSDSLLPHELLVEPEEAPAVGSTPSIAAVRSCFVNSPVLMLTGHRTCGVQQVGHWHRVIGCGMLAQCMGPHEDHAYRRTWCWFRKLLSTGMCIAPRCQAAAEITPHRTHPICSTG